MFTRFAVFIVALLIPGWTIATEVPDTQQNLCYNTVGVIPCPSSGQPFYGQDGNYHSSPRSFTKLDVNSNPLPDDALSWTMVLDNVTGLIWEVKTTDGGLHDRDNLYKRCDNNPLTNGGDVGTCNVEPDYFVSGDSEGFINALKDSSWGGHSDWRVPSIYELKTLIHWGRYLPAANLDYFPNTMSGYEDYLSSTYFNGNYNSGALAVNFSAGNMRTYSSISGYYLRAVRGTVVIPPSPADNLDFTIADITSGLMWQKDLLLGEYSLPSSITWQEALDHCEGLDQANHSDWRLPRVSELLSIVNYSFNDPALDTTVFGDQTFIGVCWSSTTKAETSSRAWGVYFTDGQPWDMDYKVETAYVRCVRGGTTTTPYDSHTLDLDVTGSGKVVITDLTTGIITGLCESSCNYQYQEGTLLSLTAIADTGASFSVWSEECPDVSNGCLITMDTDKVASAMFLENGDLSGDGRRGVEEVIIILKELTGEN